MIYTFDTNLAKKLGLDEAIFLQNIAFWVKNNKANNHNFFDGTWWTYNSAKAFSELFEFWSEKQIRRIIKSLLDQEVIIDGMYSKNAYDRTKWYALAPDYMWLIDCPKREYPSDQMGKSTLSDNKPIKNTQPAKPKKPLDLEAKCKIAEVEADRINLEALQEWLEYKAKDKLTQKGETKSIRFMAKYSHADQQVMVDRSIMSGYKGLFEPRSSKTSSNNYSSSSSLDLDLDKIEKAYE